MSRDHFEPLITADEGETILQVLYSDWEVSSCGVGSEKAGQ
jgi:hypothetical protein